MIRVQYCKAYDIYRLQEDTNETIAQLEDQGNDVIEVSTLVTSGSTFYSQIVYKTPTRDV